jgi:signal transduction histidine kinase
MEHDMEDEAIFIQQIKQSSASLLKLINDILFLSRLDAGMITINPKPIDLAGTSEERCERVWGSLKKPGVSYIVRNSYKKLVVEIDDANFSIIMNKIITNAVQYTKSGSVTVGCDYIGDQLYATVEDTGCGIDAKEAERIFERFVKLDNFKEGLGLGLTLCRMLARRLNGNVRLDTSYAGPGARFVISLPL